ncbi:M56 family metallopeptidase, partial [Pseudoxanthomonas taiwanensis]
MDAELVLLLRATLALTVAGALVLALRRPARALWGAQGAYLLWTCVPVAVLAASLPKGTTLP